MTIDVGGEECPVYLEPELMAFRELLARFLQSQEYSPNTVRSYTRVIDDWIAHRTDGRWLKERALTHVKQTDATAYIKSRADKRGKPDEWGNSRAASNSVHHAHSVLRKFYAWLIEDGQVTPPNPFAFKVSIQEDVKRVYDRLTDEQVSRLIMLSDVATVDGRRDHAIMALLFGIGLRRSEISTIAVGDIIETSVVKVRLRRQKNKKLSCIPCPIWTGEALLACRADRIAEGATENAPLFVKKTGPYMKTKPVVSQWFVYRLFRDYCDRANIPERFTPHCARATAITKMLESGMSYEQVKEVSRHQSIRMVGVYDKRRTDDEDHPILKIDYARKEKIS